MPGFELLLMRHGQAEDYADGGDAARPLTSRGRDDVARVGRALRRLSLMPNLSVSSPLLRARQTAEIVAQAAGATLDAPQIGTLVPGAAPAATINALLEHAQDGERPVRLLAVGHNPNVTAVLATLVSGRAGRHFDIAPGDLAHLRVDAENRNVRAILAGFYPSRALATLIE